MRRVAAICLLTIVSPIHASAQLPLLEGLFKKVTDVNLFGVLGRFANRPSTLAGRIDNGQPRSGGLTGLGFEVSFDVGEFSPRTPKDPDDPDNRWLVELALGYTEVQDFVSAQAGLDVRGAVRELPSASLYLNYLPVGDDDKKLLGFYGGIRTGLAHLQSFRGYVGDPSDDVTDSIYSGGGTTFQFGVLAGVVAGFGRVSVFVEPGYTRRRFSSVEWVGISGTISDLLPRSLDMSTFSIAIGTQLAVGAAAPE
jgi:hypothetical protein